VEVNLRRDERARLDAAFPLDAVSGMRYPEEMMKMVDR
jgi:hypothetical protein